MLRTHRRRVAESILHEQRDQVATADLDGLERVVNELWVRYCERLVDEARGPDRAIALFDRLQRTDRQELMDREDLDEGRRGRLLANMDRFNRTFRSYAVQARALYPTLALARCGAAGGRDVRLLDVGSGRGGFPRYLADNAPLPLAVVGSDVHSAHVEYAALQSGPASFRVVNGFAMDTVESGEFDVVSCVQSLHHFTPGQLARMIREGFRVATTAFVGIDGVRSPLLGAGIVGASLLVTRSLDFVHDAVVTARRFYHDEELRLIARLACPDGRIDLTRHLPAFVAVRVIRPG